MSYAADVIRLIQAGTARGGSFGFVTPADAWSIRGETPHRVVLDMAIREVSIAVAFPAYDATSFSIGGLSERHGDSGPRRTSIALAERQLKILMAR